MTKKFKRHPLSAAFGSIVDAGDLRLLRESIEKHGFEGQITVYEDMILDGWHRYEALLALKMDPTEHLADLPKGENPVEFVIRANDLRRHVSKLDRAVTRWRIAYWRRAHDKARLPSVREMAESIGVGHQTAATAKQVVDGGFESVQKLDRGKKEAEEPPKPPPAKEQWRDMTERKVREQAEKIDQLNLRVRNRERDVEKAEHLAENRADQVKRLKQQVQSLTAENETLRARVKELTAQLESWEAARGGAK